MNGIVASIVSGSVCVLLSLTFAVSGSAQENPLDFRLVQNLGNGECFKVLFGDISGNGFKDAVVINFSSPSKIWINQGDGTYTDSGKSFAGGYNHGGALGDIDGDGDLDLVIVSTMAVDKVYKNDGSGNFSASQSLGTANDLTTQVLLADIDGDSDLDMLTSHTFNPNKIWLNDGQGSFTFKSPVGTDASYYMNLADIDQDGDLDLYVEYNDQKDVVLLNNGLGDFSETAIQVGLSNGNGHGVFREFNGDTFPDLFIPNDTEGSSVWINTGNGNFTETGTRFGNGNTVGLLDADLDGDLDAILSKMDGTTQLFINYGDLVFRSYGNQFAQEKCWSINVEDIDNDGDEDFILGNSAMNDKQSKLFLNQTIHTSSANLLNENTGFRVYPNPAKQYLIFEVDLVQAGDYRIELVDQDSRQVSQVLNQFIGPGKNQFALQVGDLSSGIYYCSLLRKGRLIGSKLVVLL